MTRYLIFLTSLIVVEGALLWGLETAVRIIIKDDEYSSIYRWAIRILSIEIAHYATCAFVFWDISVFYPMLIPVLTLTATLAIISYKNRRKKISEYQEGHPRIPEMMVRMRKEEDGQILTIKCLGEQYPYFMSGDKEKTFFIRPHADPLFRDEKMICEWYGKESVIGSLVPLIEGSEYALLLNGTELPGLWTVSVFCDSGITEISYLGRTLLEIRSKEEEGIYDVFFLKQEDPVWKSIMQSFDTEEVQDLSNDSQLDSEMK